MRPGTDVAPIRLKDPANRRTAPVRISSDSLSRPDGIECRCLVNRAEVLESPFERRIQQVETEIDFGIGRSQWRGDAHYPIGCTGAHDVGAQPEMQSLIGDGIGERARRVPLAPIKRFEFYS